MQVNIRITQENYLDFNVYHATHAPNYLRSIIVMALTVPLAALAIAFVVLDQLSNNWVWLMFAGVVSIYWVVTTPRRFRRVVRRHVQKITARYNEFVGEFSLTLHPEHISFVGSDIKGEYPYSKVEKVVWNKGCYYVIVGSVSALIVPENSFNRPLAEQEFLDALREQCPNAKFLV